MNFIRAKLKFLVEKSYYWKYKELWNRCYCDAEGVFNKDDIFFGTFGPHILR